MSQTLRKCKKEVPVHIEEEYELPISIGSRVGGLHGPLVCEIGVVALRPETQKAIVPVRCSDGRYYIVYCYGPLRARILEDFLKEHPPHEMPEAGQGEIRHEWRIQYTIAHPRGYTVVTIPEDPLDNNSTDPEYICDMYDVLH